ncbi:MAG: transposase [Planctomycetaceae bacterium]|nr:transposase [Planctomycetaceae bacterium]
MDACPLTNASCGDGFISGAIHSRPGQPNDSPSIESFIGRLREEYLNQRWFQDLTDAVETVKFEIRWRPPERHWGIAISAITPAR